MTIGRKIFASMIIKPGIYFFSTIVCGGIPALLGAPVMRAMNPVLMRPCKSKVQSNRCSFNNFLVWQISFHDFVFRFLRQYLVRTGITSSRSGLHLIKILKTFLDYPCDISVGMICSQRSKEGQGVNNIADRTQV